MFKFNKFATIIVLSALVATPAFAGCHRGDTPVLSGPHAGQCAHHGGAGAAPQQHARGDRHHMRRGHHQTPDSFQQEPEQSPSAFIDGGSSPVDVNAKGVQRIVTRHPLANVAAARQFRCRIESGQMIPDDVNGTGWCTR